MTDSTLTPPAADMMSFLSTTPEHKDSEYETPVHTSQRTELNVIVEDGPDSKLRLAEISAAANPLLAAARPLLCALAAMPAKLDAALVEPYRNLLVREMHLYQTLCDQANLRREHVLAVRYCLCTALDEAANNTTWGRRGVWAGKSLLVTFHGESEGGIKLFQIIGRLAASFQEHGNVLEVIYHLLGLGFEGRYSVQPDGRKQLDNIRQQLLTQLSQRRDPVMPALSPDFQGAISGRLRRMRRVPVWLSAGISAIVSAVAGGPGAHNVTVSGSAVPPGALLFASLDGGETLSELFSYVVQLKTPDTLNLGYVSPAANLPLKPMVGKDLCVNIELDGGGKRHISGLVTAARVVGHEGRSVTYELRMEPWVKLLTHTSDYKAFQNKTVVDILDEVLAEYPYPVEKRLVESYPVRTWQVQYGETDFDFLQRLMQEWGIYWWFEHSEDSHTLVLADAISAHKACPDSPLVEWHQEGLKLDKEFIHTITANESLRTGQWVLDDFDFTKPRSLLANTVANPRETGHATYEHYE